MTEFIKERLIGIIQLTIGLGGITFFGLLLEEPFRWYIPGAVIMSGVIGIIGVAFGIIKLITGNWAN